MLSSRCIQLNSFKIGDEIDYDHADKQYIGTTNADVIRFNNIKMYEDDDDLIIVNDVFSDILEGKIASNRLKVGNWNFYTNDDVMTIEHSLQKSRVESNEIEMQYTDNYAINFVIYPFEQIDMRIFFLSIQCHDSINAMFAYETLLVDRSYIKDSNVNGSVLNLAVCYNDNLFHTPRTMCSMYFLNRSVKILDCKCVDVGGYELPTKIRTQNFSDSYVDVTENNRVVALNNMKNPKLSMDPNKRYVFMGDLNNLNIKGNKQYLTENGIVSEHEFMKDSKYKYILIHPDKTCKYYHKKSKVGNEFVVIS